MISNIGIVIPFYYLSDDFENDVKTLQETINSIFPFVKKIIVVNDGTKLSNIYNAQLIKHEHNIGKGTAIRTGLAAILSDKNIKFVIEVDADNDQDPKEVVKFLEVFKSKNFKDNYLVIGDRYTAPEMKNPGHYRESINKIQTLLFNQFGFSIRDSVSGFRGYSRAFANEILHNSKSNGFGIATEELILAYLTNTTLEKISLDYAKPRKIFTKAYKLSEVIEGITIHKEKLNNLGHLKLINSLEKLKFQFEKHISPICFKLAGKEFNFRYHNNSYTID